jgi:hypothetical protein
MPKEIVIRQAHEAAKMAEELIPKFHLHLLDARLLFLFTTQERKKCNRVRLGSAAKLSALQRYLSSNKTSVEEGFDFLILIDQQQWAVLTHDQRVALIDHELCHCGRVETAKSDGTIEGRFVLLAHEIEEFYGVVQRHGLWRRELEVVSGIMKQLDLPLAADQR